MSKFLMQLYLRFRLWWFKRKHGTTDWVVTIPSLVELINLLPYELLSTYDYTLGRRIAVTTGFKNSEQCLQWLDAMTKTIEGLQYVPDVHLLVFLDSSETSLDEFLATTTGRSVPPDRFAARLTLSLGNLDNALSAIEDPYYRDYYLRKLRVPIKDTFSILEGLLIVALNV